MSTYTRTGPPAAWKVASQPRSVVRTGARGTRPTWSVGRDVAIAPGPTHRGCRPGCPASRRARRCRGRRRRTPSAAGHPTWSSPTRTASPRAQASWRTCRLSTTSAATMAAMLDARELNLTLDFCLRVGELLLSSGAGAADVTATMQSLCAGSSGVAQPRGRRHVHLAVDELPDRPRGAGVRADPAGQAARHRLRGPHPASTTWSATSSTATCDLTEARTAGPDRLVRPRAAALGGDPGLGRDVRRRRPAARRQRWPWSRSRSSPRSASTGSSW